MPYLLSDDRGVILVCSACGSKNRIAFDRLGHAARCAKCHADIVLPSTPLDVDSTEAFDTLTSRSAVPVLVDFWAAWCGPCRMVAPQVEQVAGRAHGKFLVVKVNTDELNDLSTRLGIRSIPTLAVFANGREAARQSGVMPADQIEAFVQRAAG